MKIKTSELTGMPLDWAVGSLESEAFEGLTFEIIDGVPCWHYNDDKGQRVVAVFLARQLLGQGGAIRAKQKHPDSFRYNPHENWAQGGPIIEREKLSVKPELKGGAWYGDWRAVGLSWDGRLYADESGSAALIAAMRCYVASKLGDEVDVPAELLQRS